MGPILLRVPVCRLERFKTKFLNTFILILVTACRWRLLIGNAEPPRTLKTASMIVFAVHFFIERDCCLFLLFSVE